MNMTFKNMTRQRTLNRVWLTIASIIFVIFTAEGTALAYIGPGAGIAFASSFLVLLISLILALLTIILWPLRLLVRSMRRKRPLKRKGGVSRVIVLGFDGMDPVLTDKFLAEGKLPNLSKLKEQGTYSRLDTTVPAMSPVAWSTFITGVDPSRHNIFDFLNRDLRTYMPELSSTRVEGSARTISLGRYNIPLGRPRVRLLRKGRPFWDLLGKEGIFCSVLRVPMTFPPEKLNGVLLSGMCVPDLKGTQGTFTYYTSRGRDEENSTGGVQIPVELNGNSIETYIPGPENHLLKEKKQMRLPLKITIDGDVAELSVSGQRFRLKRGAYSGWIRLTFNAGLNMKVTGICRFFIKELRPSFEMYMTPINIDPERPTVPISFPSVYSIYLSKMLGSYATLGLAEDTWALNERVIDEDAFLEQVYRHHREREQMFFNALDRTDEGLCVCVFDATDRVQHMFMRFITEGHPALSDGPADEGHGRVIEDVYREMDSLVGKVLERMDDRSVLMVISDHGFKPFVRGVNLNTWLYRNGYLSLVEGKDTGGDWFRDIDWTKTKAYTFGLGGIYINEKGRESKGIVPPEEKENLKRELMEKLRGLKDEDKGEVAIKEVFDVDVCYNGPYRENGPDLIVGYNVGYRASWGAAVGRVDKEVFEDNKKSWSGDHCMDPRLVPGVFFCNKKLTAEAPHIMDMAPTILELFGVEVPPYMTGKSLTGTERRSADDSNKQLQIAAEG